jgi:lambda family phage tail tape measure protein
MAQNIARLGVVLGISTAEFTQGLGKATQKLSEFVDKAKPALLGVGAAMVALTAKTVAYADEVTDIADANDLAISSVMALGTALAVSGGKAENAGKMLSSFSAKIDNAAQGNEEAQKTFQRLGISLADIASSTNEQLLDKVVQKLASMTDPITRNALAMEVFSKAGKNISWNQFAQQLDESRKKYEENEAGIRAMAEAADELQIIMKSLMGEVARGVGEDLKLLIDYLKQTADNTSIVGDVFRTVFETVVVIGSDIAFVFGRIAGAFDRFKLGIMASGEEVSAFWAQYNKESEEARNNLDRFQRRILDNSSNKDAESQKGYGSGSGGAGAKRAIEETKKNQAMLQAAQLLSEEYRQQEAIQLQQLAIAGQMVGMTQNEVQIQQAINAVIKSTQASVDSINKKRADAVNANASKKVIAEYDAQIEKIYEMQDTFIEMSRNVAEATIATQMTFEFGWNKAFKQYAEDAENYGKLGEDMFRSFTGNMNNAIDEFVDKGTFSFSRFTESVIKDLIKIQLRMQMAQLMSKAFGGGGLLGSLFGGGMSTSAVQSGTAGTGGFTGVGGASFTLPGAADGGPIDGPTLVGERGPEIFIPKRAGTVIPNHQLGDAMGGGGTTFNGPYIANMSAIDTQSGVQFLAKNKMSIWSMNQSASRSVPTNR